MFPGAAKMPNCSKTPTAPCYADRTNRACSAQPLAAVEHAGLRGGRVEDGAGGGAIDGEGGRSGLVPDFARPGAGDGDALAVRSLAAAAATWRPPRNLARPRSGPPDCRVDGVAGNFSTRAPPLRGIGLSTCASKRRVPRTGTSPRVPRFTRTTPPGQVRSTCPTWSRLRRNHAARPRAGWSKGPGVGWLRRSALPIAGDFVSTSRQRRSVANRSRPRAGSGCVRIAAPFSRNELRPPFRSPFPFHPSPFRPTDALPAA
jgi:hypothetical protein